MNTYVPNIVQGLRDWYSEPLSIQKSESLSLKSFCSIMAERLYEAYQMSNPVVCNQINNYHPSFIGMKWPELQKAKLIKEDALDTIAYEHGYEGFASVPDKALDSSFEHAVDALVNGDLNLLRIILKENPGLSRAISPWGHQAQLIHYLGNNGVELYRQSVPHNAVAILKCLIEHGSDPNARMSVYGGQFTVLELFKTSAHPFETEIRFDFIEALASLGAL